MISTAKQLEEAEKTLRQIVCDLAAGGSGSPNVYATMLELAEVGKKMQERIAAELRDEEAQRVLRSYLRTLSGNFNGASVTARRYQSKIVTTLISPR